MLVGRQKLVLVPKKFSLISYGQMVFYDVSHVRPGVGALVGTDGALGSYIGRGNWPRAGHPVGRAVKPRLEVDL